MNAVTGTRLGTNTVLRDDGTCIFLAQPLTRSGWCVYSRRELDPDSADETLIDVFKPPSEISAPGFLASIEGRVVTLSHPGRFVSADDWSVATRGHVQNVRCEKNADGDITVFGDIHLHDAGAITRVQHGLRGLSLGYSYTLSRGPKEDTFSQVGLRCNHLALVNQPRMGTKIVDASKDEPMTNEERSSIDGMFNRILGVLEKLVANQTEPQGEEAVDADLITAVTPKSAASQPGSGKPKVLGNLTSATTSFENNINPVTSTAKGTSATGWQTEPESGGRPDAVGPTNHVVDALRGVRALIEASGDDSKIALFNAAMVAAKSGSTQPAQRLLTAFDRDRSADLAGHFQDSVEAARARMLGRPVPERAADRRFCRTSLVAADQHEEPSFEDQVRARRREMLAGGK